MATISVKSTAKLNLNIEKLVANATEKALHNTGLALMDKHFDKRQSSWKPLSQYTIKQRTAKGYGAGPILQQTGRLRQAVQENSQIAVSISGKTVQFSIRLTEQIGSEMQHGVSERNVPARPFFDLSPEDVKELVKAIRLRK